MQKPKGEEGRRSREKKLGETRRDEKRERENAGSTLKEVNRVVLIFFSLYRPLLYYGFYCSPHSSFLYTSYSLLLVSLAAFGIVFPFFDVFHSPHMRNVRVWLFVIMAAFPLWFMTHVAWIYGSVRDVYFFLLPFFSCFFCAFFSKSLLSHLCCLFVLVLSSFCFLFPSSPVPLSSLFSSSLLSGLCSHWNSFDVFFCYSSQTKRAHCFCHSDWPTPPT